MYLFIRVAVSSSKFVYCNALLYVNFQEKKGAPPMDPKQKEENEIAKLDKILSMVREPNEDKK